MLQGIREGVGLSLRLLAAALADDGGDRVSFQHLGRVESGERAVTPELAYRVIQACAQHIVNKRAAA